MILSIRQVVECRRGDTYGNFCWRIFSILSILNKNFMYESFFGLKRRPFLFVPDAETYFSVDLMEESLQTVSRTIQNGEGISLIFGAEGTGKTLLLRLLRQSLASDYTVALVSNSRLETPKALFLQLAHDLRLACSGSETVELRLQILDFSRIKSPKGTVLLFDEAQHLNPAVLEEIRLLTDPADGSAPLFRAVFAGTPDFEEKLTLPKLEAFNQRVVSRCYLGSFTSEETLRYIAWHTGDMPLFTEAANRQIYRLTDGVPRLVNQLCDASMQFAAEKGEKHVVETQVNAAWASLQHIAPVESESADIPAVKEPVLAPEQIAELVEQKRKTFRIRPFVDSVEFGTLADSEQEPSGTRTFHGNNYKPPFPEDEDEVAESETESAADDEIVPPCRVLHLHVLSEREVVPPEPAATRREPTTKQIWAIAHRKKVPDFAILERKFRRKYLLEKIQHRLGLFAGLRQKTHIEQPEHITSESDMNTLTLQEYGAAVLDGRPPFVRKEPHYAYQTSKVFLQNDVTYPDPKTGIPVMLRWLPEQSGESERFGVSYSEFLNKEKLPKQPVPLEETPPLKSALPETSIVRTSLNASQGNQVVPAHCSGLEEVFEESQQVGDLAISLAELFRAKSSALQQIESSPEFRSMDAAIQRQLDAVIQRIVKAAEKIEQAAEISVQAGQHVSQAAEFVEAEVKSALPTYTDLFRQWSDFQELISTELESLRQRGSEPIKFRTLPRRQVMIERVVSTIDVESLLR